ncbi:hypothetical protein C8R45DRAFT_1221800 [Mycena sanguinolenta]|nr:hypothetical protein C8R45DRAFT_1221800 [Mycena sanguinolenta]
MAGSSSARPAPTPPHANSPPRTRGKWLARWIRATERERIGIRFTGCLGLRIAGLFVFVLVPCRSPRAVDVFVFVFVPLLLVRICTCRASPAGNWLTGGDHIKDFLLLLLLVWYLHQLIEGALFVTFFSPSSLLFAGIYEPGTSTTPPTRASPARSPRAHRTHPRSRTGPTTKLRLPALCVAAPRFSVPLPRFSSTGDNGKLNPRSRGSQQPSSRSSPPSAPSASPSSVHASTLRSIIHAHTAQNQTQTQGTELADLRPQMARLEAVVGELAQRQRGVRARRGRTLEGEGEGQGRVGVDVDFEDRIRPRRRARAETHTTIAIPLHGPALLSLCIPTARHSSVPRADAADAHALPVTDFTRGTADGKRRALALELVSLPTSFDGVDEQDDPDNDGASIASNPHEYHDARDDYPRDEHGEKDGIEHGGEQSDPGINSLCCYGPSTIATPPCASPSRTSPLVPLHPPALCPPPCRRSPHTTECRCTVLGVILLVPWPFARHIALPARIATRTSTLHTIVHAHTSPSPSPSPSDTDVAALKEQNEDASAPIERGVRRVEWCVGKLKSAAKKASAPEARAACNTIFVPAPPKPRAPSPRCRCRLSPPDLGSAPASPPVSPSGAGANGKRRALDSIPEEGEGDPAFVFPHPPPPPPLRAAAPSRLQQHPGVADLLRQFLGARLALVLYPLYLALAPLPERRFVRVRVLSAFSCCVM